MGAMLLVGWSTFEVGVFSTSGDPASVLALLPGWVALTLGAALVMGASARVRWLPAAIAVSSLAFALAHHWRVVRLSPPGSRLPQASFALSVAFLATLFLERRFQSGRLRTGFALGLLASQAFAFLHHGWRPHHRVFLPFGLVLFVLGLVPRRSWRTVATLLALLIAALPLSTRIQKGLRYRRADLPAPAESAAKGRPNLVLVVMDTVRADRLSCYGYERPTTPGLDAFARDHATLYERARSTASWTLPSHASLFTGRMPADHGADHPRGEEAIVEGPDVIRPACGLWTGAPTLAERLRAAGYRTGAVVANEAYLDHRFGLDRGFERYDDRRGSYVDGYVALSQTLGWRLPVGHLVYRDARRIVELGRAWVESLPVDRPFFLMLNLMDAHEPVLPPSPFDRAFGDGTPRDPLRPLPSERSLEYDRGLAYLDAELSDLLRWLGESGRFEDTVVIVTADHGEAFGERRGFFTHAWLLYEELLHVPLLVKPAGRRVKAVEPEPFSLAQLYPLVLRLTGVAEEAFPEARPVAEWYRGPSNEEIDRWAARTGHDLEADLLAWLDGDLKFIVSSKGTVEAYDLALDPRELQPIELSSERIEQALSFARAWWDAHPPFHVEGSLPTLDAYEIERMRALGYAGGETAPDE